MTTTVRIMIEGNKNVSVVHHNGKSTETPVKPGTFTTLTIHGEQEIRIKEIGDFISQPTG